MSNKLSGRSVLIEASKGSEYNSSSDNSGSIGNVIIKSNRAKEGSHININGILIDTTMNITNVNDLTATGNISATSFIATSDERLKKNIKPLKDSLNKINNISGYTYDWVNTGLSDIGVVAQEVQNTFPIGIVHDSADGIKRVDYSKFAPLFIESIKELTDMVKNLKKRIDILEADQE